MVRVVKKIINFKEPDSIKFEVNGKEFETTLNSAKNRNKSESISQRESKVETNSEAREESEYQADKNRVCANNRVEVLNLESKATQLIHIGLINLVIDSNKEIKNINESRESIIVVNGLGQVISYDKVDIESRLIEFICKKADRERSESGKLELKYSDKKWFSSYVNGSGVTKYSARDRFEVIKVLANFIYESAKY